MPPAPRLRLPGPSLEDFEAAESNRLSTYGWMTVPSSHPDRAGDGLIEQRGSAAAATAPAAVPAAPVPTRADSGREAVGESPLTQPPAGGGEILRGRPRKTPLPGGKGGEGASRSPCSLASIALAQSMAPPPGGSPRRQSEMLKQTGIDQRQNAPLPPRWRCATRTPSVHLSDASEAAVILASCPTTARCLCRS